jgi:hypothetical protein
MSRAMRIEITDDHLKLLRRTFFEWDDSAYNGAPYVDIKRPYGNSDVLGDVAEILEWELITDRDGEKVMTEDQGKRARELHEQMADVLQILVQNPLDFGTGVWVNTDKFAPYGVRYTRESA